jgi:SnoaL-like domain
MTDAQSIAQRYIDLWNERDSAKRLEILKANWTNDARYTDPLASVRGPAEISALIGGVQQRFPDFSFALTGRVDGFGDNVRFSWGLGPKGAADAPIKGTDFASIKDGRIESVTGFLDQVPKAAAA